MKNLPLCNYFVFQRLEKVNKLGRNFWEELQKWDLISQPMVYKILTENLPLLGLKNCRQ